MNRRPFRTRRRLNRLLLRDSNCRAPKIVGVRPLDSHLDDVAGAKWTTARNVDQAVDLGSVALGAALRGPRAAFIDDDVEPLADFGGQLLPADGLAPQHEALVAGGLDLIRQGLEAEVVGFGAFDGLVLERADPVEPGLGQPVQEKLKVILVLAGEADDKGRADGELRADGAPGPDALERLLLIARATHRFEDARRSVLKRRVNVGQHAALAHQRHDFVDMRIRVDVVQANPDAERAKLARKIDEPGGDLAVAPTARRVFEVE